MKKIIIFSMLLIIVNAVFSQQAKSSSVLTKQDYLKKSKKQKNVAIVLLSGGGALMLAGMIIPQGDVTYQYDFIYPVTNGTPNGHKNDGIKSSFIIFGTIAAISSIPLFISSTKNKKKAMSFSFKIETAPKLFNTNIINCNIPSITFKLSL